MELGGCCTRQKNDLRRLLWRKNLGGRRGDGKGVRMDVKNGKKESERGGEREEGEERGRKGAWVHSSEETKGRKQGWIEFVRRKGVEKEKRRKKGKEKRIDLMTPCPARQEARDLKERLMKCTRKNRANDQTPPEHPHWPEKYMLLAEREEAQGGV